ncbi:methylenetetrahydrofolate reductase [Modestobacter marinus]|uniref:methylenetetrahydrofolate reductase n=1 Tax=Modestobacter marinus TaxID=477641 RepID=UPI0027E100F7|nr:methylenetetrahydrofolate reductase [Modestobacter marinus]
MATSAPGDEGRPTRRQTRLALERALRGVSYEVLPLRGTEESVVEHVPRTVPLTVTVTEAKGLTPTVELAERLSGHGFSATPHLAARLVRDEAHLADVTAQLRAAGVDGVFVIGGDAAQPAGRFPDALSLLEALEAGGHQFREVGIGGHPEGHGHISAELIERALERKAPHATHVITQLCFHPATTVAWARQIRSRGVDLPVRIGLPGAVTRQKLVRISAGLGLGQSARFLAKQHSMFWRFFLPHGYRPDRLVERLAPTLGDPAHDLRAFHLFTFNEVARTEAWRQDWLARLSDAGTR